MKLNKLISPEEALKNLTQAARSVVANADTHDILAESLRVIETLVYAKDEVYKEDVKKE